MINKTLTEKLYDWETFARRAGETELARTLREAAVRIEHQTAQHIRDRARIRTLETRLFKVAQVADALSKAIQYLPK